MKLRVAITGVVALVTMLLSVGSAQAATAPYIVVLKPGVDVTKAVTKAEGAGATVNQTYRFALRGYAANIPTDKVSAIAADPSVAFLAPDVAVNAGPQPSKTCTSLRDCQSVFPDIARIDGDDSSTRSGNGKGSVDLNVAVLDSGIQLDHPDLNVVGGKDCSSAKSFADDNGHGTHVAGSIAAKDNNLGTVGVAPGARLWSVKVLTKNGGGTAGTIICGIDWVTSTRTDADPSNDVAVANMSLGGKGTDDGACGSVGKDAVHRAICAATTAGVVFTVAAGNATQDLANFIPAAYNEVLATTSINDYDGQPGGTATSSSLCPQFVASNPDDTPSTFSNFATTANDDVHTVAAPGLCVVSSWIGGIWAIDSGTSMASPHVAGVVALCISSGACAGLSPAQIVAKVRDDAASYSAANPAYGFQGDLLRPRGDGRIYGPLVRAALY